MEKNGKYAPTSNETSAPRSSSGGVVGQLPRSLPKSKDQLCYLTSDSENVLHKLRDDMVYIIGGIVDRNRCKNATLDYANAFGIPHAKLPIEEYLHMTTTKVLTCNHVFEILLKYYQHSREEGERTDATPADPKCDEVSVVAAAGGPTERDSTFDDDGIDRDRTKENWKKAFLDVLPQRKDITVLK